MENLNIVSDIENKGKYFQDILIDSKAIQKSDFNLKNKHNFNISTFENIKNKLSRKNELFFGIMHGEEIVPIETTQGNVKIPIINKDQLERQLHKIKNKEKISYIHISTIQFFIKSTFAQGIESPVELEIKDDRIIDQHDALIAKGKGNLKETKVKFDVNIQIGMSLLDLNLSESITIRYKLLRTQFMKKGNHPFSITYQINYALSNSHHSISFKNDEKIRIDKLFKPLIELETNKGIFRRQNISRIQYENDNEASTSLIQRSTSNIQSIPRNPYRTNSLRHIQGPPAFTEEEETENELSKNVKQLSEVIKEIERKL